VIERALSTRQPRRETLILQTWRRQVARRAGTDRGLYRLSQRATLRGLAFGCIGSYSACRPRSISTTGRFAAFRFPQGSNQMQLRVARLCLDCEELHTDNACPNCASESYAFLSKWLPSEERRRWRRPAGQAGGPSSHRVGGLARLVVRWLKGGRRNEIQIGPATRASDHVPQMNFDGLQDEAATRRRLEVQLSKHDVR
jgi:hypothetical protein